MEPSDKPLIVPPAQSNTALTPAHRSKVGTIWFTLAVFVILLLLLLVFIVQNSLPVKVHYLGAVGTIGFGVAMLLAAVAGALLVILIGSIRILQLKFSLKKQSSIN